MTPFAFAKNAWNDSVWSKVIASGITTGLGTIFVLLVRYWEALKAAWTPIFRFANTFVVVPIWLAAALGILLIGLVGLTLRVGRKGDTDGQVIEPNAVPVVEATIVTPSFSDAQRYDW